MMKLTILLWLLLGSVNLTAHARTVRPWSEAELQSASDLVVIGRPIGLKILDETNSLGWTGSGTYHPQFRGLETTFKISSVLRGVAATKEIVLHHYGLEWDAPVNGQNFVRFIPGSTNKYLLYLVKDGAHRYAPVAGQIDAGLSIKSWPTIRLDVSAPVPLAPGPAADVAPPVHRTPDVGLKLVKVDSEETDGEAGDGTNAVDGDPSTYWHSEWNRRSPGLPHEIIIELVPATVISGFTYLPRQDESDHGTIKEYEFYVSADGVDFGEPVKRGVFEPGKGKKTETFEPIKCRYLKLRALSEINGLPWTSAAEIGIE